MKKSIIILALMALFISLGSTRLITKSNSDTSSKNKKMSKKEKALAFVTAVTSQKENKVRKLANADYIQHNPFIPTGLDPFIGLFPILKENGTTAKAYRVIEDGDFVAIHHLWTGAKPFGADEMVSFDILRFDEAGNIAEHWDALMPNTPPNPSGRTLLDGPVKIEDLAATEANKSLVKNLVEDVLHGKNPGNITNYISQETYHQHNPQIRDGLDGVQEAFQYLVANNDMFLYTKFHKIIGEGNFVLTINEGIWHNKGHVFYDLFRVEAGKVVEHWDIIQEIPTENLANNNGMFGF